MTPAAALATIRAAIYDAQSNGHNTPDDITQRVSDALTDAGWHITATPPATSPHTATQTPQ